MKKKTIIRKGDKFMLDEYNFRILDELNEDSRTPLTKLGKKVNLGRCTVRERILEMEAAGIIEGYTIMINWDLIAGED